MKKSIVLVLSTMLFATPVMNAVYAAKSADRYFDLLYGIEYDR